MSRKKEVKNKIITIITWWVLNRVWIITRTGIIRHRNRCEIHWMGDESQILVY